MMIIIINNNIIIIKDYELDMMRKEVFMTYCKVLARHFPGEIEENYEIYQSE
jgi:hypothetical protein